MTSIIRATEADTQCLSELSKQTLIESHGRSAPEEEINNYILENYNEETIKMELKDPKNIYFLLREIIVYIHLI